MAKIQIGISSDDVTGANDIAIMYVQGGLTANVFSYEYRQQSKDFQTDVVIIDTDSRLLPEKDAYTRTYKATKTLMELDIQRFFKKTCSVFRGNIGAEFDAMLDALEEEFALVVLGFPDNGRTTMNGMHYVRGIPLEQSEFRNDPMQPMSQSNLCDILQSQTKRIVDKIDFHTVELGIDVLRQEINRKRQICNYLIVDVRNNQDLSRIAKASQHIKVVCGASAIAYYQAELLECNISNTHILPHYNPKLGIMSISASLMPQTKQQIDYAKQQGTNVFPLDVATLLKNPDETIEMVTSMATESVNNEKNTLVYSDNSPQIVQAGKEVAKEYHINDTQLGKLISSALSTICRNVIEATGQNRVLVAGGDTSGSFCRKMDIVGMSIYKNIESGLPSSISISPNPLFIVLKSGSFGSKEFFVKAYEHLRSEH